MKLELDPNQDPAPVNNEPAKVDLPAPSYLPKEEFEGFRNEYSERSRKDDEFRTKVEEFFNRLSPEKKNQDPSTRPAPKRSDFKSGEEGAQEFLNAHAEWVFDRKQAQVSSQAEKSRKEHEDARTYETRKNEALTAHNQRIQTALAKYPDFDAVIRKASLPYTEAIAIEIASLDNSADVEYALSSKPELAREFFSLCRENPRKAQRMLDILDDEFTRTAKTFKPITNFQQIGRASCRERV